MTVIRGYHDMPTAPACPYCGGRYFCIEDVGDETSYRIRCWCGAKCWCPKDDPDMVAHLTKPVV